jgi:hypothetical protein
MFGKYFDVGEKRDFGGAFMFFIVHLILLVGISSVALHFFAMTGMVDAGIGGFFEGGQFHTIVGSLFVMWLGGMMVSKRGKNNDIMSVIMVIAGIYLAWTFSVILGLVPIALMTTIHDK